MNSEAIRETYLSYFEERAHLRVPSASLIPAPNDTSTLLTVAGMQPMQPYFRGEEVPPRTRLCSSQRCFRTPDIEEVGNTARHLTNFEMLGNFSFGDYFKPEAIEWGWELSREGFGFDPERIWITVFEGDSELGLGPDEEAIEIWRSLGVPEERIVGLPRKENFWQAGAAGPCGPCSELYLDRGEEYGAADDRPGDDSDRFLEYWNLVFMSYDLREDGSLTELPAKNIDTGLGLERMAVIQQGVESVFDTDLLRPLVDLAAELSGRPYGSEDDPGATRAMRIIADHVRGSAQLIADGVVPSNERRGYVLRRIMRRAIYQGRVLGLEPPYLGRFAERAIEMLGAVDPALVAERESILRWVGDEEESFGRTLDRGSQMLDRLMDEAESSSTSWISAADAFELHDTYGFPYDLTRELVAERGLSVDDESFEELMEQQRERARGVEGGSEGSHDRITAFTASAPQSRFVGYEDLRAETGIAAAEHVGDGASLVKLEDSPFYAEGGGQVADSGVLRWEGGEAAVLDVYRVGDDQAVRVEGSAPEAGLRVEAEVAWFERHATMRNHTATHLLHAALRERLGTHVRQAGSAVRPDKLRFDFTHGARMTPDELGEVSERVNGWIKASAPVRAIEMDRDEAERLGAMALFGEKYGDWVRVVEVEGVSRELCGGTHVANTGEIGLFEIVSEGSSASNVRRIEAVTGPAAIDLFRERSEQLERTSEALGGRGDTVAAAERLAARLKDFESADAERGAEAARGHARELAERAERIEGIDVVVGELGEVPDARSVLAAAHDIKGRLGDAAVILAATSGEKVSLVGVFAPNVVERGISAADVVRDAAGIVGGGGGGKPEVAQAGGRDASRIGEALDTARAAIRIGLSG